MTASEKMDIVNQAREKIGELRTLLSPLWPDRHVLLEVDACKDSFALQMHLSDAMTDLEALEDDYYAEGQEDLRRAMGL